ncbi:unnamed protein product [Ascophyllum nodosum]
MLNTGASVPRIGFGTAGLGHATEESVSLALAAGYRQIDTAQAQEWYQEDAVGRALKRATGVEQKTTPVEGEGGDAVAAEGRVWLPSGVPLSRGDVFVTTKIHPRDFSPERMGSMMESSVQNLEGVDLVLLHSPHCWPGACPDNPTSWQDAWRQLEKMYSDGAVGAIGVSNFSEDLLRELLGWAAVVPATVQNWMDPFHQDRGVRALCAEKGIAFVAYSTLGGQWTYRPPTSSLPNPVSTDGTIGAIASAHGTSRQAVVLSWALQSGVIVLPRSSNPDRIRENLLSFVEDGVLVSLAGGGAGEGGGCPAESGRPAAVKVFLSDEEMRAMDRLDGILGG